MHCVAATVGGLRARHFASTVEWPFAIFLFSSAIFFKYSPYAANWSPPTKAGSDMPSIYLILAAARIIGGRYVVHAGVFLVVGVVGVRYRAHLFVVLVYSRLCGPAFLLPDR